MSDKVIHTLTKSETEEIRFSMSDHKGKTYASARVWYTSDGGKSWYPSKNGLNVTPEFVAPVILGMQRLLEETTVK